MTEFGVQDLPGARVLVLGAGVAGASAARYLLGRGAQVTVCDERAESLAPLIERGAAGLGAADLDADWPARTDLVIASPGFRPDHALPSAAAAAGVPVWGEVELAWHVDRSGEFGAPRRWLVVTGTNGKTTTTGMVESICAAAGEQVAACGNIGLPVLDALSVRTPSGPARMLAVELSSFQLFWAPSIRPAAGVVLNIAEDHLDWHGSLEHYAAAKSIALRGDIAVVPVEDPIVASMATPADTRRVEATSGEPAAGQVGVAGGAIIDRAFAEPAGTVLVETAVIRPSGPSGLADALAAATLCRAVGVPADAVDRGLRDFRVAAHRGEVVAVGAGLTFVDDSKATNPHAAQAAIAAHDRVVWLAGGQLKGASVDELLVAVGDRLAGVVLFGVDAPLIADSISRHAPYVPTVTVVTRDDGLVNAHQASNPTGDRAASAVDVMSRAVQAAAELAGGPGGSTATAGDGAQGTVVLLAPAAASFDMFAGYAQRGDMFAAAAQALPGISAGARA
ncbi:UDP-N-acetylmuramoyl-L-alanine--D-glutamate ligase [Jongsikchunia kroppenstedtii]|uniref:UDP-N-acetylmuramoyl-L-alanine--D-glutamate ligase n=1 Tax=Jongsikchunia kroppenstedtii TaxID=1121721 RepID=UPI000477A87D|nr:UDP-N-acetylmuramoyl-L-alanine--D-glutamate ligase [Jongsikchunia kroppenstedtii]